MNRRANVIEDVEWLLTWGEWPDRIADRLGYSNTVALINALQRFGRTDLSRRITRQDRTGWAYRHANRTALDEKEAS